MITIDFVDLEGDSIARVEWPVVPQPGDGVTLRGASYQVNQIVWIVEQSLVAVVYLEIES